MSAPDLAAENEHWLLLAEMSGEDFIREIKKIDNPVALHSVIAYLVRRQIKEKKDILEIIAEES